MDEGMRTQEPRGGMPTRSHPNAVIGTRDDTISGMRRFACWNGHAGADAVPSAFRTLDRAAVPRRHQKIRNASSTPKIPI